MKKLVLLMSILVLALSVAAQGEAEVVRQNELRSNFQGETVQYRESVYMMMRMHDPELRVRGNQTYDPPSDPRQMQKVMSDLAALDQLCKTKYAGIKNDPRYNDKLNFQSMYGTWCEIAAKRSQYENAARQTGVSDNMAAMNAMGNRELNDIFTAQEPYIKDSIQLLMYEREKWRAQQKAEYSKNFSQMGVAYDEKAFAETEAIGDKLKAFVDQDAPNRSFKMPPYRDATIESFIRSKYTALKGTQILKIGMDYTTWKVWKNSLGIPTSQTKRGRVLVKVANRPYCQQHEFVVKKEYKGGGYGAMFAEHGVGRAGMFMKCE